MHALHPRESRLSSEYDDEGQPSRRDSQAESLHAGVSLLGYSGQLNERSRTRIFAGLNFTPKDGKVPVRESRGSVVSVDVVESQRGDRVFFAHLRRYVG